MPVIQIQILKGRDNEQIKVLIADVTKAAMKNLRVKSEQVRVLVIEIPDTHWGTGGLTMNEFRIKGDEVEK
ncbi:tautomerase family protein [Peribacillus frigoritolerans]|uniref:tautomerase family protein n=1 Tax=Peribacillus frigoritolerans TaxID=450367 RepID=UPI0022820450|nr:tautomerase family protein [Peribacillus frigoritolerans]MCY9140455.1 tautomerase family protein [Peribacillus frigoritolerans]